MSRSLLRRISFFYGLGSRMGGSRGPRQPEVEEGRTNKGKEEARENGSEHAKRERMMKVKHSLRHIVTRDNSCFFVAVYSRGSETRRWRSEKERTVSEEVKQSDQIILRFTSQNETIKPLPSPFSSCSFFSVFFLSHTLFMKDSLLLPLSLSSFRAKLTLSRERVEGP